MKAHRERKFVLLFLVALAALPLAQWSADLAAGAPITGGSLLRRAPTVAHLRSAEAELAERRLAALSSSSSWSLR